MMIKFSKFRPKVNEYELGGVEGICKTKLIQACRMKKLGVECAEDFKPIKLAKDKPYVIVCLADGRLVTISESTGLVVKLSENEYTLYRYYCFLSTLYLWQRHGVEINMPIVFDDLFERLDENIDRQEIISKAKNLNTTVYFNLYKTA